MSNTKETKVEDHDYSLQPVPQFARRRLLTMFMIMLGFTFFSASMWTGQTLGDSLDLSGFIGSLILGGIILAIYTGSLAYVGAKTGLFPGSAGTAFLWCKGLLFAVCTDQLLPRSDGLA